MWKMNGDINAFHATISNLAIFQFQQLLSNSQFIPWARGAFELCAKAICFYGSRLFICYWIGKPVVPLNTHSQCKSREAGYVGLV